jgi:tRNA-dihydrouridine synthase B
MERAGGSRHNRGVTNPASRREILPPPIRTGAPRAPADGRDRVLQPLRPLRVGALDIGFPVVQAALSGYSDGPMRRVARRLGAPYTLAEVMIERFVRELRPRARTAHHLRVTDEEHPVGGQLMGSVPADFAPAAARLVAAGFDVIDINFGCPVRSAVGGCRGGFHLGQPAVALEIVERVREAVPPAVPVTLKMRRGLDDSPQSRERFDAILDGAFERGVDAVTVHARTVAQRYDGPSNWDFLRDVKARAGSRTILGSGDLFTAQACLDMLAHTSVDGVSVARGAIGNPWIFGQVRALAAGQPLPEPDLAEQRRVMELHLRLCLHDGADSGAPDGGVCAVGAHAAFATMRMFAIKFARLHPLHEAVRNAFATTRDLSAWSAVLDRFYGPAGR